jgi:hypothetical protein
MASGRHAPTHQSAIAFDIAPFPIARAASGIALVGVAERALGAATDGGSKRASRSLRCRLVTRFAEGGCGQARAGDVQRLRLGLGRGRAADAHRFGATRITLIERLASAVGVARTETEAVYSEQARSEHASTTSQN